MARSRRATAAIKQTISTPHSINKTIAKITNNNKTIKSIKLGFETTFVVTSEIKEEKDNWSDNGDNNNTKEISVLKANHEKEMKELTTKFEKGQKEKEEEYKKLMERKVHIIFVSIFVCL